jgi:hypothetical protein
VTPAFLPVIPASFFTRHDGSETKPYPEGALPDDCGFTMEKRLRRRGANRIEMT